MYGLVNKTLYIAVTRSCNLSTFLSLELSVCTFIHQLETGALCYLIYKAELSKKNKTCTISALRVPNPSTLLQVSSIFHRQPVLALSMRSDHRRSWTVPGPLLGCFRTISSLIVA